jgi:hypothetical protein
VDDREVVAVTNVHSTVTVTMRYTHTNIDSKRTAVDKLVAHCDKSVTICTTVQQSAEKARQLSQSKVVSYNVSRS